MSRQNFYRSANANINMGNSFRYVPQGEVTVSVAFAKKYPADGVYGALPAHIPKTGTVHGALAFRINNIDETFSGPGKNVVAFMDGLQQPARIFVQGCKSAKDDPSLSPMDRQALLEESTYFLGFCHQGLRDKHAGSKLFAVVVDGSVTTTNNSPYPIGMGEAVYACYPSLESGSGTLTQGYREGKHMVLGGEKILGHLKLSKLTEQCEVNGGRNKWDEKLRQSRSATSTPEDKKALAVEPFRYKTASAAVDALIFAAWVMDTKNTGDAATKLNTLKDNLMGARREQIVRRLQTKGAELYELFLSSLSGTPSVAEERLRDSLSIFNSNNCIDATEVAINRVAAIKQDHYVGNAMNACSSYEDLQLNVHLSGR